LKEEKALNVYLEGRKLRQGKIDLARDPNAGF